MKNKWIRFSISVILLVVLDQLSKLWVLGTLKGAEPITVIKGVFEFAYVENRGAAFGILQNQQWFFILVTLLLGGVLVYVYAGLPQQKSYLIHRICCVLVVGGAIGNLIDRIFRRYVVDFLYFKLIDFPVFNVADCFVVVGAILLALLLLFRKEDPLKKDKAA